MSQDSPSFEEVKHKIVAARLAKLAGGQKKFRSTYNEKTAREFQPAFDFCIDKMENNCVRYTDFYQLSPNTLHKKMCDGLKWLCENGDEESQIKYRALRARCRFRMGIGADEGVYIVLSPSVNNLNMLKGVPKPAVNSEWKEQFHAWIENPGAGSMLNLENLNLSQDDKEMVERLIEQLNEGKLPAERMLLRVSLNQIRIHR